VGRPASGTRVGRASARPPPPGEPRRRGTFRSGNDVAGAGCWARQGGLDGLLQVSCCQPVGPVGRGRCYCSAAAVRPAGRLFMPRSRPTERVCVVRLIRWLAARRTVPRRRHFQQGISSARKQKWAKFVSLRVLRGPWCVRATTTGDPTPRRPPGWSHRAQRGTRYKGMNSRARQTTHLARGLSGFEGLSARHPWGTFARSGPTVSVEARSPGGREPSRPTRGRAAAGSEQGARTARKGAPAGPGGRARWVVDETHGKGGGAGPILLYAAGPPTLRLRRVRDSLRESLEGESAHGTRATAVKH